MLQVVAHDRSNSTLRILVITLNKSLKNNYSRVNFLLIGLVKEILFNLKPGLKINK